VTNLLQRIRGGPPAVRDITSVDDYLGALNGFMFGGNSYGLPALGGLGGVQQTLGGVPVEAIPQTFAGFAHAQRTNGVVFAVMLVRMSVFSAVRFQFQRLNGGRPSEMFGTPDLAVLEEPWTGGTTQDLLTRIIQDADLAGNSYHILDTPLSRLGGDGGAELVRLRPDWVDIVLEPRIYNGGQVGWRKRGYIYSENGDGKNPVPLLVDEVAHFAPTPDPIANFRGMSWLTPILRETQSDDQMNRHKQKFFENGATPNMVIKLDPTVTPDEFEKYKAIMEAEHIGLDNAYKTMYIGGGGDATVVGKDFKQIDLKTVQAHGETRIAAAGGVPPVIVGLSEGLASATYSNYGQARRRYADGTAHPLWQNVAGSFGRIVRAPAIGTRLWYDARDVPFLREDEKDAADIQKTEAETIRALVDAGYKPESVVAAVMASDYGLLQHSGLFSVQLQLPGTGQPGATDTPPEVTP
jgi:phage portal protein BeeE